MSQTEEDDYDFGGASARGSLLRKEVWTYGGGIAGLVTEDDVYNGAGTLAGKTVYAYDGGSVTASSGVPQHVAVTGPRGNLTGVTQYTTSSASNSIGISATYEDTGSVLTTVTPNGTTTYSYDSTFTYLTGNTPPTPSSGVSQATTATYDTTNTGLILSAIDPNGAKQKIASYDSMLRATEADGLDSAGNILAKTVYAWRNPYTVGVEQYQNGSVYTDIESETDGYGRASRQATSNGQATNPWYQGDTCYDANGNLSFSSYRYQGNGWSTSKVCSGAGDAYTYDVLGRVLTVAHADGTSVAYTYTGRATKMTDENAVTRISQIDGLGRLTNVCEISSTTDPHGSGMPAACGLDLGGTATGFMTTYTYDLANHLTTITQGTAQTRIFKTDWLGRTTSVQEPESGITTYSYAYTTSPVVGLQVTRTKPRANQSNSTVTTATTTQYDALGRVVSVTYSDGTPTKTFAYDNSAGWSDLTQTYLKGRLSLASVPGAGTAFSYDSLGRATYLDECLPSGCGTVAYNKQLHYVYDMAGNVLSSTDGSGVATSYTVSAANELQSMTSSLSNGTNPPSLVSSVVNGPNGPVSYYLGNGLSSVYGYDSMGRLNAGWVCSGSVSTNCMGGTQSYGFSAGWKGVRLTGSSDSVLNQGSTYGYDEFNRLTSRTVNSGTTQNFTYSYDRYGNRWQQNVTAGSGPQPQLSFDFATNRITNPGYAYDATGNMTNDGSHSYTYDAEGNITAVDGGSTAQYVYNALNQRVRTVQGSTITEFVFNAAGQRVSVWNGSTKTQLRGQYYWGRRPVAYYAGSAVHFQHQDWLGTERLRTTYSGGVEGSFVSLPFGDGKASTGTDGDLYHYAGLDYDAESNTDHAEFRQYSSPQGRWMRPDPYSASYDFSNPQSFNKYAYVMNNPLSSVDPLGLVAVALWFDIGGGGGGAWYTFDTDDLEDAGFDVEFNDDGSISSITAPNNAGNFTDQNGNLIGTFSANSNIDFADLNVTQQVNVVASSDGSSLVTGYQSSLQLIPRAPNNQCMSVNGQTVCKSPADAHNFLHGPNTIHYRDSNANCSTHVVVNSNTGQVVESHIDEYNPNFDLFNHTVLDVIPDLIYDATKLITGTGVYPIPPGRSFCQP